MKKLGKAQRKANNALLTSVMIKNGTSMAQEGVPTPSNIENLRKSGTISRSDAKEMRKRAGHGLLRSWAEKTGFTKKIYTQAENTKAGEIGKKIQNRGSNEQVQDRLTGRVTNNEEKNIKKLDKYIADRNALILQLGELIRKADESNPGLVLHALEKRAKAIEEARQARETRSSEVHTNGHYARRVVELDEDEDTEE